MPLTRFVLSLTVSLVFLGVAAAEDPRLERYSLAPFLGEAEEPSLPELGLPRPTAGGGVLQFDVPAGRLEASVLQAALEGVVGGARARLEIQEESAFLEAEPQVHARVRAFLDDLRAHRRRGVAVQLTLHALTPQSLWALAGGVGAPLAEDVLKRLPADRSHQLGALSFMLRDGQPATQAELDRSTYLADYEVNQTGILPVLCPVVRPLQQGSAARLRADLLPDGRVRIAGRVDLAQLVDERTLAFPGAGPLSLPVVEHFELEGCVVARAGETALWGVATSPVVGSELGTRLLLVTCRIGRPDPLPETPAPRVLRAYSLAAALGTAAPAEPTRGGFSWGGVGREEPLDADAFLAWVTRRVPLDERGWVQAEGQLLLAFQPPALQARIATLLRGLEPRGRVAYELLGVAKAEAPAGGPVLAAPVVAQLVAGGAVRDRLAVSGVLGQAVRVALQRASAALITIERSTGGDGHTNAQADDPIVETLQAGPSLWAAVHPGQGETLDLRFDVAAPDLPLFISAKTEWGTLETVAPRPHLRSSRRLEIPSGAGVVVGTTRRAGERLVYLLRVTRLP